MEQFFSLLTLQAQLALLMIVGIWFSKKGIINDQGRKCLTDLVIDIILPCNILQSFRIDLTLDMLRSALSILIVSIVLQLFYGVFCAAAYNHSSCTRKAVLQYGTVCTNAAFLGNAITEGIFGAEGLMLTSIFLIPQRMAMWSVGVSYFMQGAGAAPTTPEEKRAHRKAVILKTIRHHRHPGRKIQRRLRLCQQVCGRFHGALPHHHPAVVPGGIKRSFKRLFLPRQREPFRLPLLNLLY